MAKDAVVKIDSELLKRVEEFVKKNKYHYSSKKQFVNLAIIEFLNSKSFINNINKNKKSNKKRDKTKTGGKKR